MLNYPGWLLLAHRDESDSRLTCRKSGDKRTLVRSAIDAIDPQRTRAPSKSRSAIGLPQCYLPLRSAGEIAGETARVHHASRRRDRMAACGARAAAEDAGDWVPQRLSAQQCAEVGGRVPAGPRRNRV